MVSARKIPSYAELPVIEKIGDGYAWDVWGRDDQLGAINFLTPDKVLAAARLVRKGKVINLNLPLNLPYPSLGGREPYEHHVLVRRSGRDDSLDKLYLQFSSQWDGLRHIRNREFGYWGGLQDEEVDQGKLGIEHWARHGIVGRGVLIDLPRFMGRMGRPFDVRQRLYVDGPLMEEIAAFQNVEFRPGDILLLRTGWLHWYLQQDQAERDKLKGTLHPNEGGLECPGLDAHRETAAWLWDHKIPAVSADNPALEALRVDGAIGFQHRRLIPLLGIAIGEFWFLEDLAADCDENGVYEFMLVGVPLNLPGGVGSPANAYAIK
jgi:kynurenine formamidase